MTGDSRTEDLLAELVEIQRSILKLLVHPLIEGEKTMMGKALKLRRDLGLTEELLMAITGVRSDNLRTALQREGLE